MKKLLAFVLLIGITSTILSQTQVSGNQSGTWIINNSPYLVVGEITVPAGKVLSIEAGVVVDFQDNYKLVVFGKLRALGTQNDSVYFTTNNHSVGWGGIRLSETNDLNTFSHCHFEYGKTIAGNFPDQHGGSIMADNSNFTVDNSLFINNDATANNNGMGGAIYGLNTDSTTQIISCQFSNNHSYGEGGAIKLSGDVGANIQNCKFLYNTVLYGGGAICLYGCVNTQINKCLFVGNITSYGSGGAALVEGFSYQIGFANCTIINNQALGGDAGAVELAYSDAQFTNTILYNNPGAYSDNIFIDMGWAEVNNCNIPMPDGAVGENNINENAQFVDVADGDFHLTENSPCIDVGIDSLTILDAFNQSITVVNMNSDEYYGSAPDMGCFEYDPATSVANCITNSTAIYPNPAKSFFFIKVSGSVNLTIFSLTGKIVYQQKQFKGGIINIDSFDKGLYIVEIQSDTDIITKNIIVN